ncbi:4-hydroxy-tetrahydrodipicolinate reductase [Wenzhouxiangella marina]|uniref:4-hydroxy-tetrahydrodipicolinate reductase n=2 Tax=Wenzhouxiangella marina TaxID=1579979 RepID=A0A0K0XX00_9GAMM|nr:4-hydroxy-tetrahydrodipicolinate reductase [Wenzhouxiangella marina]
MGYAWPMSIEVLLSGATGTIGRALIAFMDGEEHYRLAGTASRDRFFEPDVDADVVIDFSHPSLLEKTLAFAHRRRLPLVIGTTGLSAELAGHIKQAAADIPICQAANFSIGVNLLMRLAGQAAAILGEDFDLEITEVHHRRKIDAPSGTALALGATLAKARGLDIDEASVFDRTRHRIPRSKHEIGYQSIRGGDVVGEHTVHLLGDGERLELTHRASRREVFAQGALLAARKLMQRSAGLVDFADLVLD